MRLELKRVEKATLYPRRSQAKGVASDSEPQNEARTRESGESNNVQA
jgi:hypothetical protein